VHTDISLAPSDSQNRSTGLSLYTHDRLLARPYAVGCVSAPWTAHYCRRGSGAGKTRSYVCMKSSPARPRAADTCTGHPQASLALFTGRGTCSLPLEHVLTPSDRRRWSPRSRRPTPGSAETGALGQYVIPGRTALPQRPVKGPAACQTEPGSPDAAACRSDMAAQWEGAAARPEACEHRLPPLPRKPSCLKRRRHG
jgi:hypothetical protein